MKRTALALLASLAVAPAAFAQYATDERVGTLTTTGTSVNSSTVTALNIDGATGGLQPGGSYLIQCDGAVYLRQVSATDGTAASTTGLLLAASEKWSFRVGASLKWIAIISVAGTVNCRIFRSW